MGSHFQLIPDKHLLDGTEILRRPEAKVGSAPTIQAVSPKPELSPRIPRAEVTRLFESIKRTGEEPHLATRTLCRSHHMLQLSNSMVAATRRTISYAWKPWDPIDAGRKHREILIFSSRAMSAQGIVGLVSLITTIRLEI